MFFGVQILGKKRPLSNAWLLGCGRKIGKKKIMKENIAKTCEEDGKSDAIMELLGYPLYLAFQAYLAHIVRKFYIIVMRENNGYYNRYEGLDEEVGAVV